MAESAPLVPSPSMEGEMIVRLDQTWPDDVPLLPIPTLSGPSPQVMSVSAAPPNKPDATLTALPLHAGLAHIAGGAAPLTSHYFSRPGAASSSYYVAAAPLAIVRASHLHF